jgi:phage terminase large subunit GpA-like protein
MKGAQVGGTEAGNNWIGYIIAQAPGPLLVVQPTVDMAKRWSKGRFDPLAECTPCVKEKVRGCGKKNSQRNSLLSKEYPGGIAIFAGANSPAGLRSMPVRYLFLDEVDAYPQDCDGEGDPVALAIQRTATFPKRKIFIVSTPTIHGLSRVEREFEASDKRYYHLPCPYCGEYQRLVWTQLSFDDPADLHYKCIKCDRKIYEYHKTEMLTAGKWVATNPGAKTAGFHLSSLYSPVGWFSWRDALTHYDESKGSDALLKVWVNTTLGEPWTERGEAPEWERLYERAEDYERGKIQPGGLILTAGVDVQKDRLECEIVAWGRNNESWSVDYVIIPYGPTDPASWEHLTRVLNTVYSFADDESKGIRISMMAVDSNYMSLFVHSWIRKQNTLKVMAVHGRLGLHTALGVPTRVDVTRNGKRSRMGAKSWGVGVDLLKAELYGWLKQCKVNEVAPPGYCHFPKYGNEFFQQLTAEHLITKIVKGRPKQEWQLTRNRNEALDCRVYARAAAVAVGVERWKDKHWNAIEAKNRTTEVIYTDIEDPVLYKDSSEIAAEKQGPKLRLREKQVSEQQKDIMPVVANQQIANRAGRRVIRSRWMGA